MAWKWPGPSYRLGSRQGAGLALAALGWRLLPHEAPALPWRPCSEGRVAELSYSPDSPEHYLPLPCPGLYLREP